MVRKNLFIPFCCTLLFVYVKCAHIEIGNVIDLLKNYGMLTKIFPGDSYHEEFLQLQFSQNVFDKSVSKNFVSTVSYPKNGVWKISIFENIMGVLKKFFEDFQIEFVEHIEQSFASACSLKNIADFFGIHHHYLLKKFSYVLIKHQQNIIRYKLVENPNFVPILDGKISEIIQNISIENSQSVLNFISKYGSHYVESFTIGEVIYQIFAFPKDRFPCFAQFNTNLEFEDFSKCANTSEIMASEIKTLSSTKTLENGLNSHIYREKGKLFPNMFIMKKDETSLVHTYRCENPIVTSFNLKSVSKIIKDPKSSFIQEVINNQMVLRELFLRIF